MFLIKVHKKHYLIGTELEKVKSESGILGLEEAGHNLGCLEPHNLTLNTARLGASLRSRLVERGVAFIMGKDAKLVAEGSKVVAVQMEDKVTMVAIIASDSFVTLVSRFLSCLSKPTAFT